MKVVFFSVVLFFSCSLIMAQTSGIKSQTAAKMYLIKAGNLFDSEEGVFKKNMVIVVKGSIIEQVSSEPEISDSLWKICTLVDLSAFTLLPGLIDAHTHLLSESKLYPGNADVSLAYLRELNLRNDALRALYGASRAKAALESGITAVQDLGNSGLFADVALRDAINLGYVPGPRMRCSGPGLSTQRGQLPGLLYEQQELASKEYRIIRGIDDAVQAVRENVTQKADVIKIYSDNQPNVTMLSIEEMSAITREAHRYGIKVTAHATTNKAVYNAVQGGVDAIEHGYQIEDTTMQLMAKRGVVWVPTFSDSTTFVKGMSLIRPGTSALSQMASSRIKSVSASLQRGIKYGLTIVAGADDYSTIGMPYGELFKRTIGMYVRAGMTIPKALQTATTAAAKHLRWENKIGVLKKGAWADIIAVDANLPESIEALLTIHFVMKGGVVVVSK